MHVPSLALVVPDGQLTASPYDEDDDVVVPEYVDPVYEPLPLIMHVPSPAGVVPDGQLTGAVGCEYTGAGCVYTGAGAGCV